MYLDVEVAREAVEATKGMFASVTFKKRTTGEIVTRIFRIGVRKNVKGIGLPYTPKDHDLIVVFDPQKDQHNCIPLDTILRIQCGSKIWENVRKKEQSG